jgi:hypothetical protein
MSQRPGKAARRAARHAKATRRAAERPPLRDLYDVEITRTEPEDDEDDAPGWWAEGGFRLSSSGVQFDWAEDLSKLLADIADEVAGVSRSGPITVRYTLDDEPITLAELETLAAERQ